MFMILGKSQKYFVQRQVELGNLNGHIEEIYSGLNVVKVYNGKKESDKKFDELNKKVAIANQKSQFLSGIMHPLMHFMGNLGYVAVCIVGAIMTMNGYISFGIIVAFETVACATIIFLRYVMSKFMKMLNNISRSQAIYRSSKINGSQK